jgi:peptidase A4-like protein
LSATTSRTDRTVGSANTQHSKAFIVAAIAGTGLALASISVATAKPTHATPVVTASTFSRDSGSAGPAQSSATWSGYVVAPGTPLTDVSATWSVPPVVCAKTTAPQAAVFWVGLDGWYSKTVEQAGVEAYCSGTTAVYTAWWEMFPTNHITQVFSVRPGDAIAASVHYLNGIFTITVKDTTSGATSTVNGRCASGTICQRSSAEWIAESPTYGAASASLPPWKSLTFAGSLASVAVNRQTKAISGFVNFPVVMTGLHGRQAMAGSLLSGAGFTESWLASN